MEGIGKIYYDLLKTTNNPAKVLLDFYRQTFNVNGDKRLNLYIRQIVKMYGRDLVYFTILDISSFANLDNTRNLEGLINHMLKKKLEAKDTVSKSNNLDMFVQEQLERKERLQREE